jgi:hypothetical protein
MTSEINLKKGEVQVDVIVYKDGKYYMAYIPALNLTAHSTKKETAVADLEDAVNLFFEHWQQSGKLHEKLTDLGWSCVKVAKKNMMRPSNDNINVPYNLLSKSISRKSINLPAYC